MTALEIQPASIDEIAAARSRVRATTPEQMAALSPNNTVEILFAEGRLGHVHAVAAALIRNRLTDAERAAAADDSCNPWCARAVRRAAEVRLVVDQAGPLAWAAVQAIVIDGVHTPKLASVLKATLGAVHQRLVAGRGAVPAVLPRAA